MRVQALVVALVVVAAASCLRAQVGGTSGGSSVAEQYLLAQANAERAQRGLPQLRWSNELYQAAVRHCMEMARRESISHQYAGEPDLADRGKAAGAHFSRIAENVAEAPNAVRVHDAWMRSPGHRDNLLDPQVDSIGISVLSRNGQLYAVQDFGRVVQALSLEAQEDRVAGLVGQVSSLLVEATPEARQTCAMSTGYAGQRMPYFVMRYTAGSLDRLPDQLQTKLRSGGFSQAAVGACSSGAGQAFSSYSIAVLLYP